MNKMAAKYPQIKVYEINWGKKKMTHPITPDEEMNSISLYFQKNLRYKVSCPNDDEINNFFRKAIDYFNINIDNRVKNVGLRVIQGLKHLSVTKEEQLSVERRYELDSQRKRLLNQKITFKEENLEIPREDTNISTVENNKNPLIRKEKQCIKINNETAHNKISEKASIYIESSNVKYHDVKINHLPYDKFEEIPNAFPSKNIAISNFRKRKTSSSRNMFKPKSPNDDKIQIEPCAINQSNFNKNIIIITPQQTESINRCKLVKPNKNIYSYQNKNSISIKNVIQNSKLIFYTDGKSKNIQKFKMH